MADKRTANIDLVYEQIRADKIIAIVRGVDSKTVVQIAEAIYAGGIKLLEITCNTSGVMGIIEEVSKEMDGRMLVGAGTVITEDLARQVHRTGARFVLAPDVNPQVISYCLANDIAVIPGAMTATEVLTAHRLGAGIIKLFPAGVLGVEYVKQLRGPISNVDLLAVGGVDENNMLGFIRAGCVGVGVGGSLIRNDLVAANDWNGLTRLAAEFVNNKCCK